MPATPDSEALVIIQDIHEAFRGVRRGRITLHEAEVIDDYGTDEQRREAQKLDTEESWDQIPDEHIEKCIWALAHLDPESWRHYIAPHMIWSLRYFRTSNSVVSDFTIYTFAPSADNPELHEYSMQRYQTLNEQQSRAVCRFLRYMAKNGDYADDRVAREALNRYWGKFCLENDT